MTTSGAILVLKVKLPVETIDIISVEQRHTVSGCGSIVKVPIFLPLLHS